jgi:hypothetical protein
LQVTLEAMRSIFIGFIYDQTGLLPTSDQDPWYSYTQVTLFEQEEVMGIVALAAQKIGCIINLLRREDSTFLLRLLIRLVNSIFITER